MVNFVKKIISKKQSLEGETRHLFQIAYKNLVGNLRSAWRGISNFELEQEKSVHIV